MRLEYFHRLDRADDVGLEGHFPVTGGAGARRADIVDEDIAAAEIAAGLFQPFRIAVEIGHIERIGNHLAAMRFQFAFRRRHLLGIAREKGDIRALAGEMFQSGAAQAAAAAGEDDFLALESQIHFLLLCVS